MPTSVLENWPAILQMAREVKPSKILDVGPGYGKGGLLLREYLEPLDMLDAVEAEPRYLEAFGWLRAIYDAVYHADARSFDYHGYDLVVLCDVLEHLTREEGVELLRRIPGRVIICTPSTFFQNDCHDEYPTEEHRSVWTAQQIMAVRECDVWDRDAQARGFVLVRTL